MVVARDMLNPRRLQLGQLFSTFDFVCTNLSSQNSACNINLVIIYRNGSKPATIQFFDDLALLLSLFASYSSDLVIAADMNLHLDILDDRLTVRFTELLREFNLKLTFYEPTHTGGHMLDCIIVPTDFQFTDVFVHPPNTVSDHSFIGITFPSVRTCLYSDRTPILVRRWRNFDLNAFNLDLVNSCIGPGAIVVDRDPDRLCELYYETVTSIVDRHAPLVTINTTSRNHRAPWFDYDCIVARRATRSCERKFKKSKSKSEVILQLAASDYRASMKTLHVLYRQKESHYWLATISANADDSSKLWETFLSIMGKSRPKSACPVPPQSMADFFVSKVEGVRAALAGAPPPVFASCGAPPLVVFEPVDCNFVMKLLLSCAKSSPLDPLPHWLLKTVANTLAPFITTLVNSSLAMGMFPTKLKHANVTPVLKKPNLDPLDPKNYRPISNLPFLGKLIERVVAHQICNYLTTQNLLPAFQSAYRPGHSTETALVKVVSDIASASDSGSFTAMMLLDLSAAFDTVDHAILLRRLSESFGFSGPVIDWCRSYLVARSHTVRCKEGSSERVTVTVGVPQGSVLGPLFFALYTAPVLEVISQRGLTGHMFADDSQAYKHFQLHELHDTLETMDSCFTDLQHWMSSNGLKLNPDKTEFIIFSSRLRQKQISLQSVTLGGTTVRVSDVVKNLGVLLDAELSFKQQCLHLASACFWQIKQLWQIRFSLDRRSCEILVHAFVTSRLDYCNAILVGCNKGVLAPLQRVQNAAARLVTVTRKRDHVTPLFLELHWLRISDRIIFKVGTLVFKCLHEQTPGYLAEGCQLLASVPNRRSSRAVDRGDLVVPRTYTATYGKKSFFVSGPSFWNSLPVGLRACTSAETFKNKLKTFLLT